MEIIRKNNAVSLFFFVVSNDNSICFISQFVQIWIVILLFLVFFFGCLQCHYYHHEIWIIIHIITITKIPGYTLIYIYIHIQGDRGSSSQLFSVSLFIFHVKISFIITRLCTRSVPLVYLFIYLQIYTKNYVYYFYIYISYFIYYTGFFT